MPDERLYSITEAAEKLGVSPATIATWIRLGIARASRQDELGRNRYTNADLVEMERRFHERQDPKGGGGNPPPQPEKPPRLQTTPTQFPRPPRPPGRSAPPPPPPPRPHHPA